IANTSRAGSPYLTWTRRPTPHTLNTSKQTQQRPEWRRQVLSASKTRIVGKGIASRYSYRTNRRKTLIRLGKQSWDTRFPVDHSSASHRAYRPSSWPLERFSLTYGYTVELHH